MLIQTLSVPPSFYSPRNMKKSYLYLEQWIYTWPFWSAKPVQLIPVTFSGLQEIRLPKTIDHLSILIATNMFLNFQKIVVDELKGVSQVADNIISSTVQTSVTCNACLCCDIQEENFDIITLPVTSPVPKSIQKFLALEELMDSKRWFCSSCNDLTNSTKKIKFIKGGNHCDLSVAALRCLYVCEPLYLC